MFVVLSSPLIYFISSLLYLLIIATKKPALVTDHYGVLIQSPFGQTRHIRWCEIKKISYSLRHFPTTTPFSTCQCVNIETKNINKSFQIPDFLYKSSLKKLKQELEKEFKKYKNSK